MNSSLLPPKLYSASNCINHHYPDVSLLTWVRKDESSKNYCLKLGLDSAQYQALQTKVDNWFDRGQYSWGGVLIDLEAAREFAKDYLSQIKDLKLIAIAIISQYRDLFLRDYDLTLGVDLVLQSSQTIEINRGFFGYEILAYESGSFCSFLGNHWETELKQKLAVELNQYGLITSYSLAKKTADYIDRSERAEPLLWLPWAIIELEI